MSIPATPIIIQLLPLLARVGAGVLVFIPPKLFVSFRVVDCALIVIATVDVATPPFPSST